MLVFTESWLFELAQRYRNHKRYTKPFVYFVATEDEFYPIREEIEKWVAILPEHLQKKAIANLQAEKSFQQTYHELVIGSLLRALGLQTEYEKVFSEQTPDWYVSMYDRSQCFIVEVFTENISQSAKSRDSRLFDLHGRISELPFDIALNLHVPFDWNAVSLDSRRSKIITDRLEKWLADGNPQIGDELPLEEFSFEVFCRDRGYSHVLLNLPPRHFWVIPQPLSENIQAKIRKYKDLITLNKIPFVVAVLAEFRTGYDTAELENVLFGQEIFDLASDSTTKQVTKQAARRKNNGLFMEKPLLSGVIWAGRPNMGKWAMKSYLNPSARNPLPAIVFGNNSLIS